RPWSDPDLDDYARMLADPEVMRYLTHEYGPLSREEAAQAHARILRHWQERGFGEWAAIEKASNGSSGWTIRGRERNETSSGTRSTAPRGNRNRELRSRSPEIHLKDPVLPVRAERPRIPAHDLVHDLGPVLSLGFDAEHVPGEPEPVERL